MINYKLLFLYLLILIILSVNCELTTEKMIGGLKARAEDFKYHVGIIGKHNNTRTYSLACSAGIISDMHVMGNADCFFDSNNELKKLRFFVVLGSVNLKFNFTQKQDVVFIYSYTSNPITNRHYIVILQLKDNLNLNINSFRFAGLFLPPANIVYDSLARVAGYGLKSMEEKAYFKGKTRPKVTSKKDYFLTYANVEIIDGNNCRASSQYVDTRTDLCGMITEGPFERRGLCMYDEGAPLALNGDTVVGVAHRHRSDCDNTVEGQLYTKVTAYLGFIRGVRDNSHVEYTVTHYNRPHMMDPEDSQ